MVLRGAFAVLNAHHPRIFMEVHSTALLNECSSILEGIGYKINVIDEDAARDVFQLRADY